MTKIASVSVRRVPVCASVAAAIWTAVAGTGAADTLRIAVAADPGYLDPAC
ncbi:hypothetical protein [Phaeobacter porticola]|uniref:hypothetical protein n=1 Tax=Phaeobacter porticola TaxID=1844006 RepID=UPI0012FF81F5|nr:hypothetical protein [Phaeobacter porticola]